MKRLPSHEEIVVLLDCLDQGLVDAMEDDILNFKRWRSTIASALETWPHCSYRDTK